MKTITLTNVEAVPMIFSLISAGRHDLALSQMERIALMADAFGKDLEIVVLPHDELTGQFQILLMAVGMDEPIRVFEPLTAEQVEFTVADLERAYPSAEVVRV